MVTIDNPCWSHKTECLTIELLTTRPSAVKVTRQTRAVSTRRRGIWAGRLFWWACVQVRAARDSAKRGSQRCTHFGMVIVLIVPCFSAGGVEYIEAGVNHG